MNTTSMEYTICQALAGGNNPLILSEFTGVSLPAIPRDSTRGKAHLHLQVTGSMKAAVKVNPWDLGVRILAECREDCF